MGGFVIQFFVCSLGAYLKTLEKKKLPADRHKSSRARLSLSWWFCVHNICARSERNLPWCVYSQRELPPPPLTEPLLTFLFRVFIALFIIFFFHPLLNFLIAWFRPMNIRPRWTKQTNSTKQNGGRRITRHSGHTIDFPDNSHHLAITFLYIEEKLERK